MRGSLRGSFTSAGGPIGGLALLLVLLTACVTVAPVTPTPAVIVVATTQPPTVVSPTGAPTAPPATGGNPAAAPTMTPIVAPPPSPTPAGGGFAAPTSAPPPVGSPNPSPAPTQPAVPPPVAKPAAASLRGVDWWAAWRRDPAIKIDNNLKVGDTPYVTFSLPGSSLSGHPVLAEIVYVDLDGDGGEEAAIPLSSGGSAGNLGLVVFRAMPGGPRLVTGRDGYQTSLAAGPGRLIVRDPIRAGWEPNCCPSGLLTTAYGLRGDSLTVIEQRGVGLVEALVPTVERFYELITARQLAEAYKLLSPAFQAANPYERWAAGFATTREARVTARLVTNSSDQVTIELVATDAQPGGGTQSRRFAGTWRLRWSDDPAGWQLHEASIRPAEAQGPGAGPGRIIPLFDPVVTPIQRSGPVLRLPTEIAPVQRGEPVFARLEGTSARHYAIELAATPDCNNAGACHLGAVSGSLDQPPALDGASALDLPSGLRGRYQPSRCGASCSDAIIEWTQDGVTYRVALKGGSREAMLAMASSMIANGPVR